MKREQKISESENSPGLGSYGLMQAVGLLLCAFAVFCFLSLASYDWRDVSALCAPPNQPASNLIGVVGAQVAYNTFLWLGFAAWIVPLWCALLGLAVLSGRYTRRWLKVMWAALFTFSLACVLQLAEPVFEQPLKSMNMELAGGFVGWLGMTQLLQRWLSTVGGGLIAWCLFLVSGIFLLGLQRLIAYYHIV